MSKKYKDCIEQSSMGDDTAPSKRQVIERLREYSVGDADHDFAARATEAGGPKFSEVYETNNYKYIGTPNDPQPTLIEEEFAHLSKILPFMKAGDARTGADKYINAFRKNILQYGTSNVTPGTPYDVPNMNFKRFEEDGVEYKVKVLQVAKKENDVYTWYPERDASKTIYDFLNPHGQNEIAFTIDAVNVKFYEPLVKDIANGRDTKNVKYLLPREGINDAAGKVVITSRAESLVQVSEVHDTAPYNVMYPRTDMTRAEQLSELECFFSNYNLALSAVQTGEKVVPSTTLSITDIGLIRQVQVLKHSKEDSHPNAVATLALQIKKLLNFLKPGPGDLEKKMAYYAALQQKRSGDWLQVLSCLQPERFGLDPKIRPILCSVDKICVAYALFAGIDVCMTSIGANGDYWLILMYKAIPRETLTPIQVYTKERDAFINSLPTEYKTGDNLNQVLYTELKTKYNEDWAATDDGLKAKLNTLIVEYPSRESKSGIETHIKLILHAATTLCVFRTIIPKLRELPADLPADSLYANAVNADNVAANLNILRTIRFNFSVIKSAIDAQIGKAAVVGDPTLAIATHFRRLKEKSGNVTLASKRRGELIDKLQIFGSLFSSANSGVNGVGIFSFLNQGLSLAEKNAIKGKLESFKGETRYSEKIGVSMDKYDLFLDTVKYLIPPEPPTSGGAQRGGAHPNAPDFVSSVLISTIDEIYKIKPAAAVAAEAVAAEAVAAEPDTHTTTLKAAYDAANNLMPVIDKVTTANTAANEANKAILRYIKLLAERANPRPTTTQGALDAAKVAAAAKMETSDDAEINLNEEMYKPENREHIQKHLQRRAALFAWTAAVRRDAVQTLMEAYSAKINKHKQEIQTTERNTTTNSTSKKRRIRENERHINEIMKPIMNLVDEADMFASLAEKCVDEESTLQSDNGRADFILVGNEEVKTSWASIEPKDEKTQLDTVLQVTDYGPALAILRGKTDLSDAEKAQLKEYENRYYVPATNGQPEVTQLGGGGIGDFKYHHNPLTTFYFLLRELSWRLSEPERDDYDDCVRLSQLVSEYLNLEGIMPKANIIKQYLYLHDLERYFLYFDSVHGYSKCEHYFIKDVMTVVRDTYLLRPATVDETFYEINLKNIEESIKNFQMKPVSYEDQIDLNLNQMTAIIESIKKFESDTDVEFQTPVVGATPRPRNKLNSKTNRKRFGFSPKNINYRPVPTGATGQAAAAAAAAGGSLRKHRKTKSKRRHMRKTKKRKNFVV